MSDRRETIRQYLAIWNGERPLDAANVASPDGAV
jgi:hypothetical protein